MLRRLKGHLFFLFFIEALYPFLSLTDKLLSCRNYLGVFSQYLFATA